MVLAPRWSGRSARVFRAKWMPVRVKKTRAKRLRPWFWFNQNDRNEQSSPLWRGRFAEEPLDLCWAWSPRKCVPRLSRGKTGFHVSGSCS